MDNTYHCGISTKGISTAAPHNSQDLLDEKCKVKTKLSEIEREIEEYNEMITHSIQTNDKNSLAMWRRALQTAKIAKRRLANS